MNVDDFIRSSSNIRLKRLTKRNVPMYFKWEEGSVYFSAAPKIHYMKRILVALVYEFQSSRPKFVSQTEFRSQLKPNFSQKQIFIQICIATKVLHREEIGKNLLKSPKAKLRSGAPHTWSGCHPRHYEVDTIYYELAWKRTQI